MADSQNIVSGKASESLDLMVSGELLKFKHRILDGWNWWLLNVNVRQGVVVQKKNNGDKRRD